MTMTKGQLRNYKRHMLARVDQAQEETFKQNYDGFISDLTGKIRWKKDIDPDSSFSAGQDCTRWVPQPPSWGRGEVVMIDGERYKLFFDPPQKGTYSSRDCIRLEPYGSFAEVLGINMVRDAVKKCLAKYIN